MNPQIESIRDFRLPDLGEGLTEVEIVRWLVTVGDAVTVDQPMVEVETAKATVEVPCCCTGVVSVLHGRAGDVIGVGELLYSLAVRGEALSQNAGFDSAIITTASTRQEAAADASGNVLVGYGTTVVSRRRGVRTRGRPVTVISPAVRKLARDSGLDITTVTGSGPDGLVLREDVEAAIASRMAAADPVTDRAMLRRIPLRGLRLSMAERLTRSRREIPEATVWVHVDATESLRACEAIQVADTRRKISVLALLARFCVAALRRYPELNACIDTEHEQIVLNTQVNLGIAMQTPRGLVVPVIRNAQEMTIRQLSTELNRLTEGARASSLTPIDMTGGTFTVNNYGIFGIDGAAAIINHPEVAIFGIGRIADRPWVVDGQLTVRKITELTLAFDHRVCDGETAGGFLRFVADCVERPATLLGDL